MKIIEAFLKKNIFPFLLLCCCFNSIKNNIVKRNNTNNLYRFIWLSMMLLALWACRTEVETYFRNFNPVPVVNSTMVPEKPITVYLSMAEKINSLTMPVINNTDIELVSYNCWAEQPCSGRAYAICTGN